MKWLRSAAFGVIFTLVVCALSFYLDWLKDQLEPLAIVRGLLVVVILGVFQAVIGGITIRSEREKKLDRQIKEIGDALHTAYAFEGARETYRVIDTNQLLRGEREQKEVWIVLEDPKAFEDDPAFLEYDRQNMLNGAHYAFFISDKHDRSMKWLTSELTREDLEVDYGRSIPVGNGTVEFIDVDPAAFFFFSPITVWNPRSGGDQRVFWDFPKHPPDYHIEVPQQLANRIMDRLYDLWKVRHRDTDV